MLKKYKVFKHFSTVTEIVYGVAAMLLCLYAVVIIFWTLWNVCYGIYDKSITKDIILQSISAIIISIAIVDVSKYFVEEEIFRKKQLRSPNEARMTLTRVFVIISISLSLEGLIYVFRAGEIDISLLPYPAILILTAILTMMALGHYQKSSVITENELESDALAKTERLLVKKRMEKRENQEEEEINEAKERRLIKQRAEDAEMEEARNRRIVKQQDEDLEHSQIKNQ